MSSRALVALSCSACVVGVLAFFLWSTRRDEAATSADDALAEPVGSVEADLESVDGPAADVDGRRVAVSEPPASDPDPSPSEDGDAPLAEGPAAALARMKPGLLDQFEASFAGVVDPEIFLEAALQLVQLEVDPRAIPEPDPTGGIRFPILGTPEGMSAELRVARTRNQTFAEDVTSVILRVDPGTDPYIVEGASRVAPQASMTVWRDRESGDVTHFAVLCTMDFDAQNRSLGLAPFAGEIPMSVHYSMDVNDPLNPVTTMSGIQNGSFVNDLDRPFSVGPNPQRRDLRHLSSGLLAQYEKAKAR